MNVTEALTLLESRSQRQRLEAVRFLARTATEKELPELRKALRAERVPWIRSALEAAVARSCVAGGPEPLQVDLAPLMSEDALTAEVYARATEELTDRIVHEIPGLLT